MGRVVLVVLFLLIAGYACSNDSDGDSDNGYSSEESIDQDTSWSKGLGETTCDDWFSKMTDAQRFSTARVLLFAARNNGAVPSNEMTEDFQDGISNVCEVPQLGKDNLIAVGGSLYLTEPVRFAP